MGFFGIPVQVSSRATDPNNTDRSTVETLQLMVALATSSSRSPQISILSTNCLMNLPYPPTKREIVRALYHCVKRVVQFREDESTLVGEMGESDPFQELLISPDVLVSMPTPMGDCDDFSMLLASLLVASKIPVWYVAIAVDPQQPDRFSHVYCKCYLEDEQTYLTLDASHGNYIGWETPRKQFRRIECFVG